MSRTATFTFVLTTLVAGALVSCDKSPTRPSVTPTVPVQTTPPVTIRSIAIQGPATVAPGTTAQYVATATMSDGSARDVTSTVTWRSSNDLVLAVAAGGSATAGKMGQVVLAADTAGRRTSMEVLVLAPGTFRVTGVVSESGLPLADASVDVLDGSRPTMSARTDFGGSYYLFGVAGDIEVRASKEGFASQVNRIRVSENTTSNFTLVATDVMRLAGNYTLTLTASPQCASTGTRALPTEARIRMYTAAITQEGTRLNVVLGGASLASGAFTGRVIGNSVTFTINGTSLYYYYYYYLTRTRDFVEILSSSTSLVVGGTVTATASPTSIAGTLAGALIITRQPSDMLAGACGGRHGFVLDRQ